MRVLFLFLCFFTLSGPRANAGTTYQPAIDILRKELGLARVTPKTGFNALVMDSSAINARIESIFLAPMLVSQAQAEPVIAETHPEISKKKISRRKIAQEEKTVPPIDTKKLLEDTTKKYAQAHNIQMDVKKELTLKILAKTNRFHGKFYLTGIDKLRLELEGLTKSIAVLNGKALWLTEFPQDPDDKVRVMQFSLGEKAQNQILVTSVLGKGQLLKSFKITKTTDQKQNIVYLLQPIKAMEDVKDLEVTVAKSDKLITHISYLDSIENRTTFEFSNIKFDDESPKDLYKLVVPKGAEVTQM